MSVKKLTYTMYVLVSLSAVLAYGTKNPPYDYHELFEQIKKIEATCGSPSHSAKYWMSGARGYSSCRNTLNQVADSVHKLNLSSDVSTNEKKEIHRALNGVKNTFDAKLSGAQNHEWSYLIRHPLIGLSPALQGFIGMSGTVLIYFDSDNVKVYLPLVVFGLFSTACIDGMDDANVHEFTQVVADIKRIDQQLAEDAS